MILKSYRARSMIAVSSDKASNKQTKNSEYSIAYSSNASSFTRLASQSSSKIRPSTPFRAYYKTTQSPSADLFPVGKTNSLLAICVSQPYKKVNVNTHRQPDLKKFEFASSKENIPTTQIRVLITHKKSNKNLVQRLNYKRIKLMSFLE